MANVNANQERVNELEKAVQVLTGGVYDAKGFYRVVRTLHREFSEACAIHGEDFGTANHAGGICLLGDILDSMEQILEA